MSGTAAVTPALPADLHTFGKFRSGYCWILHLFRGFTKILQVIINLDIIINHVVFHFSAFRVAISHKSMINNGTPLQLCPFSSVEEAAMLCHIDLLRFHTGIDMAYG